MEPFQQVLGLNYSKEVLNQPFNLSTKFLRVKKAYAQFFFFWGGGRGGGVWGEGRILKETFMGN